MRNAAARVLAIAAVHERLYTEDEIFIGIAPCYARRAARIQLYSEQNCRSYLPPLKPLSPRAKGIVPIGGQLNSRAISKK
jgi:hypothetical protein